MRHFISSLLMGEPLQLVIDANVLELQAVGNLFSQVHSLVHEVLQLKMEIVYFSLLLHVCVCVYMCVRACVHAHVLYLVCLLPSILTVEMRDSVKLLKQCEHHHSSFLLALYLLQIQQGTRLRVKVEMLYDAYTIRM